MTHRTDELTQLPLRSAFIEAAHASLESALARGAPLSLLVVDVDHFKLINDTYGHLQGDDVLQRVADILRQNLRGYDVAARYAGDEFVALLPDTPLDRAREVAERICAATRQHAFSVRERPGAPSVGAALAPTLTVTLSVGVSAYPDHGTTAEALFDAADRALYHVKRNGRDGVATAGAAAQTSAHLPLGIERFVGRVEEVRALVRLLEDASAGRPRVVAISGEAGVGKSALIQQLAPEVRLRGGTLVTGRCHEADVQPPYGPWAEVIDALRRRGAAPADVAWRELPQLVPSLGGAAGAPAGDPRGGGKYLLLDEIAEFVRAAARERPLVIVLDDVQWADAASWDTLEHLVPQLEDDRVLVCLTIRAEETQGESLERRRRLSRLEAFREIALERLTRDELRQWVEAAFHRQEVGREFLAFLYRQSEGNPLFVVQLLRTLLDEGLVWHSGERWEWKPVSELRLPVGVGDLIARRLGRLSPKAHAVLTACAVLGREFDVDLAIDAGVGSEDDLLDAVDEGVRAAVLHPAAERGGDRYAFTHALLADSLRESVNARRLKRIHANIARAMERRAPDAVAEIATHYDRGGDAAGAYRYAMLAAERARQVYAHQEGTEFLRVAERNASSAGELAEVRVHRAAIAEATGRYDEAEELCDLAIEWFAAAGARARALSLRLTRERIRSLLGQPARTTLDACLALDAEARALIAAGVTRIERDRVQLLRTISQMHGRLGERGAAERVAWECVRLAERVGDPALVAASLQRLAVTLERERPEQALEVFHRALDLFRDAGDCAGQASCHNSLGIVHTARSDWPQAELELSTAIALGRTAGTPDVWGLYTLNLGVVFLKVGDHDRARDLFGEALALFAAVRHGERQLYALYNLAHLELERGELNSAAELFDVTLALARQVGDSDVEIGAIAGGGLARLERGERSRAEHAAQEAGEALRARPDWFQGRELAEALRVCAAAKRGALDEAYDTFRRAFDLARECDFYSAAWLTARCADALLPRVPLPPRAHDAPAVDVPNAMAERAVAAAVRHYAAETRALGYRGLARRYEVLLGEPPPWTGGQIARSA